MAKTGAEGRACSRGIDLYSWCLSVGYKCAGRLHNVETEDIAVELERCRHVEDLDQRSHSAKVDTHRANSRDEKITLLKDAMRSTP